MAKDNIQLVIDVLKKGPYCKASSFTFETAKEVQKNFDDVIWLSKGRSSLWGEDTYKMIFFHTEKMVITDIENPEHYLLDEDTEYLLYPEDVDLLNLDPETFVVVELTGDDFETMKTQLVELGRYDILMKMEI
jgi:hypothetical protein